MQRVKQIPFYFGLAFLAYMPFHIFLSQSLSLWTGGLDAWKIAKDILLALITMFAVCLVWLQGRAGKLFRYLLLISFAYGALHGLLWLSNPDIYSQSAIIGSVYNLRLPAFLMLGYSAVLLKSDISWRLILKIVLTVSTIVAVLGILQYFLPKDILTHLGYGVDRGTRAAFFIDDNPELPRIMSTLRDPTSLGAYLILPATTLALLILRSKNWKQRYGLGLAFAAQLIAILLTFSRSAWIALALSLLLAVGWQYRAQLMGVAKRFWLVGLAVLLIFALVGYTQRQTTFYQQYVVHGSNDEDLDSNDYHRIFLEQGLRGIAEEPVGHGPGTAGLASIQNPEGSFLTENYYVQIAYEVGVLGLLLFLAINMVVYIKLWTGREWVVVCALLATFWGYAVMNTLLHTWSNEAVAAQWWLLAGLALGFKETP